MPEVRRSRRVVAVAAVGAAVALPLGAALWFGIFRSADPGATPADSWPTPHADPRAPDPREVFATPFRNVKAGVAYVGDDVCAACHRDIAKRFHAHPMGRSAERASQASAVERYDAA